MQLTLSTLPVRARAGVAFAAFAGAAVSFHLAWAAPQHADMLVRQGQMLQARRELAAAADVTRALREAEERVRALTMRIDELRASTVPAGDAARTLRQIQVLAETSGLWITGYKPAPEVRRDRLTDIVMTLEFEGTYAGLVRFLRALGELPALVSVAELRARAVDDPSSPVTLTGTCRVAATVWVDPPGAAGEPITRRARAVVAAPERGSRSR